MPSNKLLSHLSSEQHTLPETMEMVIQLSSTYHLFTIWFSSRLLAMISRPLLCDGRRPKLFSEIDWQL